LLDERRFDEWLELLTDDIRYWMPMRRNVPYGERDREYTVERLDMSWFDEGKTTLTQRVLQMKTGAHWCEEPFSRISHLISNVRLLDVEPAEVRVSSRFVVHKNRLEDEEHVFIGRRMDTLRRVDASWKIARREIRLDQNVLLAKNLTAFF
ncbi:MAG: 3-phenylpropionate/cinnamic acid dioxygenase subunit beta, partial [Chloroflexi bacterium]|nr:3-phenylpropionate/cinnamic acid dioxygenase subunit beta [Chloroflexota bacterium]